MEHSTNSYRAAAVQAAPVYLDLDATVKKACRLIEEAAAAGARLVTFPEAFLPGYPWWIFVGPGRYFIGLHEELLRNAVTLPGPAAAVLGDCCRRNRITACIPVNEKEGNTLYLTQLWFGSNGDLIGRHRKLNLIQTERMTYGCGDGSTMRVMNTQLGRLGGLMGEEHMIPVNLPVMASMGEQIHAASWTAYTREENDLFSKEAIDCAIRYYAQSTGTYILLASSPYTKEMSDRILLEDWHEDPRPFGGAYTAIINPHGRLLAKTASDSAEEICYADIDTGVIPECKYLVDIAGHYTTPAVLSIDFNPEPLMPVRHLGKRMPETLKCEDLNPVREEAEQ